MDSREASLWSAQLQAEALFAAVLERGLIAPGILESELSDGVHQLARELYGVKRHWHRRVVRSGANTLLTYDDAGPDRRLADDDIVFLDFGPVFANWEADLARSYVLGTDPDKHRLVADIHTAFRLGQSLYEREPSLTAGDLYDYVAGLAGPAGWTFGATTAGHLVDAFPHATAHAPGPAYSIRSGNPIRLREPFADGRPRHWILEIHFVDAARGYGGFVEELLTIRGEH